MEAEQAASGGPAIRELPMFPLQRTLLPTEPLPLHVFEPRYRELTRHCLETDRLFGVALIMRGSEVGVDPDQERSAAATLARIEEAQALDGGRWLLQVTGVARLRIHGWLHEAPYPRALTEPWADPPASPADARDRIDTIVATFDRLAVALESPSDGSRANRRHSIDAGMLSSEPATASFQLCAAAPLGELDRLRLLGAAGTLDRLDILVELLGELEATVRLMRNLDDEP